MNLLLLPSLATLVFVFFCKDKKNILTKSILFFLLMFFIFTIFRLDKLRCEDNQKLKEFQIYFNPKCYNLEHDEYFDYRKKIERHFQLTKEFFELAWHSHNNSDFFDRKKVTEIAIVSVITGFSTKNITSGAISALAVFLSEFALEYYDRWDRLNSYVLQAQYNYDMFQFYIKVLEHSDNITDEDLEFLDDLDYTLNIELN